MRRSRLGIGLQWVALAGIILQPLPMARSYWTDSDGNGAKDWVADPPAGDPWFADNSDGDGMTNEEEVLFGSDPYRLDSDLDGMTDKDERDLTLAMNGYLTTTDPWSWDSDSDGFSDHDEYYAWLQGSSPMVNYNNLPSGPSWSGGAFFTYFDADGDGIHNQDDMEPVTMDRDNDGIPNWQDSYMDDHWNGAGDPNAGGSGGSGSGGTDPGVIIGGTWYPSGTLDGDNDGIPDHMDPYPSGSYFYNGSEYGGAWSDRDWDGIPDGPDPFPDGSYTFNGVEYGGVWVDQDNDGVPDPADPWPSVLGSFWYEGMEYPGTWQDADGDGIPDFMDSWPNSRWNGEPSYFYNGIEYGGAWVDRDADGVPDPADNWQDDPENGIDSDGDGLDNYTERTLHLTDPYQVDSDNDFLTDYEELYVFHTLPLLAISQPERGQTVLDGYLHMGADSDGDELPDLIEDHYASLGFGLDKTNPADAAGDLDGDGITNLRAYHYGWDLVAQLDQYDADRDGITDAREDAWAAMAMGTALEGRFNKALFADAVEDPDGDGLFNFEESARDWDPTDAHSYCSGATDGQIGAWMRDVYRPGFDHGTDAMGNPIHANGVGSLYRVEEDADQDNLPDGYEYWVLNAQGGTPPPATLDHPTDQDGDGMDDLWEYRHQLDLRDILDSGSWVEGLVIHPVTSGGVPDAAAAEAALIDPDFDGLSNWREYQFGTNPRIQDTDGDGVGDALELLHNTAPTSRSSLPPLVLTVLGATSLNVATGQPLSAPLTVRATRAGVPMPQVPVVFTLLSGGGTLGGQGGAYTTHTNASGVAAASFVTPVTPGTSAITAQTQSAPPTSWSVTSTQNPGPTPDPTPDPAPTPTPQPNFPASAQVPAILENQWMISSFEDALEWNNLEEWTWSQSGSPLGWSWVKTWSGQSPGERSQIGIWLSNGGEGGGNGSAAEASIRVIPESIAQGLQWEPTPFPLQVTGSWTTSLTPSGGLGSPPDYPGANPGDTVLRAHHARIGETYGGTIRKIRLRRHPGHDPRLTFSRSFIKVVEITGQPIAYEGVTLTIQPGQATSKPVILNGMASAHGQTRSERLLPVEVIVPDVQPDSSSGGAAGENFFGDEESNDQNTGLPGGAPTPEVANDALKAATELKVAKLEKSLRTANGINYMRPDQDPDRFYVRLPGFDSAQSVTVKIATVENPEAVYNDDPTEVPMSKIDGAWRTPSMLLVADTGDDGGPFNDGIGADEVNVQQTGNPCDRTHLIQLGGKMKVVSLNIDGTETTLDIRVPVNVKKTVTVNAVIMADAQADATQVRQELKLANERFAQVGIKFTLAGDLALKPVPSDWTNGSQLVVTAPSGNLSDRAQYLLNNYGTPATNADIHVFYVNGPRFPGPPGPDGQYSFMAGISAIEGTTSPAHANNAFIGRARMPFTLAHELGHILTNAGHYGGSGQTDYPEGNIDGDLIQHNLMHRSGNRIIDARLHGRRRLYQLQENMIRNHWWSKP